VTLNTLAKVNLGFGRVALGVLGMGARKNAPGGGIVFPSIFKFPIF
jgi:hypothetical protein